MSEEAVIKYINAPLTEETVKDLHAGDVVRISGYIYTARDAAHKRLYEALERGEKLPLDLTNNVIYYVGPTPAKPGEVVGSAGPTTSGRMDKYTPTMIEQGMRGMIGKGLREAWRCLFRCCRWCCCGNHPIHQERNHDCLRGPGTGGYPQIRG